MEPIIIYTNFLANCHQALYNDINVCLDLWGADNLSGRFSQTLLDFRLLAIQRDTLPAIQITLFGWENIYGSPFTDLRRTIEIHLPILHQTRLPYSQQSLLPVFPLLFDILIKLSNCIAFRRSVFKVAGWMARVVTG